MEETTAQEQEAKNTSDSDPKLQGRNIYKILFLTLLFFLIGGGVLFAGYWYAKNRSGTGVKERKQMQSAKDAKEVPFGDEDFDKDPQYQKAVRETTGTGKTENVLVTYINKAHKFSFRYPPAKVFLEETNGKNLPVVYLDTELIVIPKSYDGPLTPVEIRASPLVDYKSLEEAVSKSKGLFVANTVKETKLNAPLEGVRLSGRALYYGVDKGPYERALVKGETGIIVIDYIPGENFPKALFDQIFSTFKVL